MHTKLIAMGAYTWHNMAVKGLSQWQAYCVWYDAA